MRMRRYRTLEYVPLTEPTCNGAGLAQRRYAGAMKLAVASDHAGVALKARVLEQLLSEGHQADDLGTNTTDPVDYPPPPREPGRPPLEWGVGRGVCTRGP